MSHNCYKQSNIDLHKTTKILEVVTRKLKTIIERFSEYFTETLSKEWSITSILKNKRKVYLRS